ncbi:hypothetical protein RIF29_04921 [Crotalaria pallida]|uniref:Uncharacterized protein n=1 Tax=Crotalaria pallida TaxID=3830 RepID=A0AAN9J2X9_CROPI
MLNRDFWWNFTVMEEIDLLLIGEILSAPCFFQLHVFYVQLQTAGYWLYSTSLAGLRSSFVGSSLPWVIGCSMWVLCAKGLTVPLVVGYLGVRREDDSMVGAFQCNLSFYSSVRA